jgi:hypothetical protein
LNITLNTPRQAVFVYRSATFGLPTLPPRPLPTGRQGHCASPGASYDPLGHKTFIFQHDMLFTFLWIITLENGADGESWPRLKLIESDARDAGSVPLPVLKH